VSHVRFVAQRYLFGKHRVPYIVFISRIAIIGMALGVATLLLAMAILRGFESVVTDKIIGFDTHIRIEKLFESGMDLDQPILDTLSAIEGVEALYPIVQAQIMLQSDGLSEGALLEAMPLDALYRLESVSGRIEKQELTLNEGLILGRALAERLQVAPGDYLLVYHLDAGLTQGILPSMSQVRIAALYESGMVDYDKLYVYSSLSTAASFLQESGAEQEYGIYIDDIDNTTSIVAAIDERLPYSHLSVSWRDRHNTLFNWMRTQELPILIIFGLIMVVAVVNIASTLVLIILEKRQEIGTLRALGTSRRGITAIFAMEGLLMGVVGVLAGLCFAFLLGWLQASYGFIRLPSDVYFMDTVAIQFSLIDTLLIATLVLALSVFSALIPALQASKLAPAEALRYE